MWLMLQKYGLLLLLLFSWSIASGQTIQPPGDSLYKTVALPMFDFGFGWSFLQGDIPNSSPAPSPVLQFSYGLSIRQPIAPYLSASLGFATAKFYGEQALGDSGNINYSTSVITQSLHFSYEASHLFNENDKGFRPYQPYVGVGVGLISFRAKGDLKDANNNSYNYWNDGSLRDLPETLVNQDLANTITRDFVYESDLRDANLDGFGRYDQMSLSVPFELGFRFQFTKRIGAHIKGVYHLNFTDLLDNITVVSTGNRAGNPDNDNHITATLGLTVFLGEHRKLKREKKKKAPKLNLIATAQDSITEVASTQVIDSTNTTDQIENDEVAGNRTDSISTRNNAEPSVVSDSSNINVGTVSSLIDTNEVEITVIDVNSISKEIDQELTTSPTTNSQVDNQENNKEDILEKEAQTSEISALDLIDKTAGIESTSPKLAGSFHWADLNKDGYISADEVLHFIDLLFDAESKYTIPMIHELTEYYFDQD
ncbi:MAG: hypothetical protein ACI9YU_000276 [Flavobacteriales bacterium]|jgi:hypothetical protein